VLSGDLARIIFAIWGGGRSQGWLVRLQEHLAVHSTPLFDLLYSARATAPVPHRQNPSPSAHSFPHCERTPLRRRPSAPVVHRLLRCCSVTCVQISRNERAKRLSSNLHHNHDHDQLTRRARAVETSRCSCISRTRPPPLPRHPPRPPPPWRATPPPPLHARRARPRRSTSASSAIAPLAAASTAAAMSALVSASIPVFRDGA
jgi:hypothetical protein